MNKLLNIEKCLLTLSKQRSIFHSEADFQFALAWEIQKLYPSANIRLEYHLKEFPNIHIDIIVFLNKTSIPIELKYKTSILKTVINEEPYNLKNHSAQDLGKYDCLKDIQRLELLSNELNTYEEGYAIWITNDKSYINPPQKSNTIYKQFSIHHGAIKTGEMSWSSHASASTIKNREKNIILQNEYSIQWKKYSSLDIKNGDFFYSIISI